MECISCSLDRSCNRAVVDTAAETRVAHLCFNCETLVERLEGEYAGGDAGDCLVCGTEARYAIPRLRPDVDTGRSELGAELSYSVTPDSPWLCERHLPELGTRPPRP